MLLVTEGGAHLSGKQELVHHFLDECSDLARGDTNLKAYTDGACPVLFQTSQGCVHQTHEQSTCACCVFLCHVCQFLHQSTYS